MRKLLKYDFNEIFKIWWIGTVAVIATSALGAACLRVLLQMFESETVDSLPMTLIAISCMLGVVASYFAIIGYALVVLFSVMKRFYCHLFTDEGYLTFTLPVKRSALLGSKVLAAFLINMMSLVVEVVCLGFFFVAIYSFSPFVRHELLQTLAWGFEELSLVTHGFLPVYMAEFVLYLLASSLFGTLFGFLCITIGSIVAKRQKILASIGIYYAGNMAVSGATQIVFTILSNVSFLFFENFSGSTRELVALALIGLFFVLAMAGLAVLCWFLILRLLKRRLNLA